MTVVLFSVVRDDLLLLRVLERALRLPPSARSACAVSSTSFCCARNASPSFCVQSSFSFIIVSTCGNTASDFTLGSHVCCCRASSSALSLRPGLAFTQRSASHDLERIGRGHQDLREQRVGIQRDRRDELVELLLRERLGARGLRRACGGRGCRGRGRRLRGHRERQRSTEHEGDGGCCCVSHQGSFAHADFGRSKLSHLIV